MRRAQLPFAHRRSPREVVLIDRRFALRGLAIGFDEDSGAEGCIGGDDQIEVPVGGLRPAGLVGGNHLVHLRIAGPA